jgi:acyl carrier protein
MLRFQDLMAKFLDTQKSVMTTFLQGGGGTAPSPALPLAAPRVVHRGVEDSTPATRAEPTPAPRVAGAESSKPREAAAPAKPATDRAWITAQLQDLISKRTGYPKDMLGLDIDLEADLGIDSIKRVEILAEMAQALGATEETGMPAGLEMEKLTAIGTLRGIIDYLDSGLNQKAHAAPKKPAAKAAKPATNGDAPAIQRAVVAMVDCPLLSSPASLLGPGVVVLTDDGNGVAADLAGDRRPQRRRRRRRAGRQGVAGPSPGGSRPDRRRGPPDAAGAGRRRRLGPPRQPRHEVALPAGPRPRR